MRIRVLAAMVAAVLAGCATSSATRQGTPYRDDDRTAAPAGSDLIAYIAIGGVT